MPLNPDVPAARRWLKAHGFNCFNKGYTQKPAHYPDYDNEWWWEVWTRGGHNDTKDIWVGFRVCPEVNLRGGNFMLLDYWFDAGGKKEGRALDWETCLVKVVVALLET